jgi:uncharacterized protein YjbJ (UPF0337 family)
MDATTRIQDRMQQRTQEASQVAGRGMESIAGWLEAQQHMWRDVMQFSTEAARQQLRFWWELQSTGLEMWTAPASGWMQVQREAASWYERSIREGMDSMQRAIESMTEDGRLGPRRLLRQQWPQLRARLRQQWGKLTDEELDQIQGNPDALIGKLQEHYGRSRAETEQDLSRWLEQQQRQAA